MADARRKEEEKVIKDLSASAKKISPDGERFTTMKNWLAKRKTWRNELRNLRLL